MVLCCVVQAIHKVKDFMLFVELLIYICLGSTNSTKVLATAVSKVAFKGGAFPQSIYFCTLNKDTPQQISAISTAAN